MIFNMYVSDTKDRICIVWISIYANYLSSEAGAVSFSKVRTEFMKPQDLRKSSAGPAKANVGTTRRKELSGLMNGPRQQGESVKIQNEGNCKHPDTWKLLSVFAYSAQEFPIYDPGLPVTALPPPNLM